MADMSDSRNPPLSIVGGHPALDLVNTVAPRHTAGPDQHEYLAEPADLLAWAARIDLITTPESDVVAAAWRTTPAAAQQALHATVEIREALYAVLAVKLPESSVGRPNAAADSVTGLETLTLRWAAASARSELVPGDGPAGVARLSVGSSPGSMIQDRLARLAVDLVCTIELGRLKACPADAGGCGWLFIDLSRNGSRRWCSMADCGAVVKARRLTEHRRSYATGK